MSEFDFDNARKEFDKRWDKADRAQERAGKWLWLFWLLITGVALSLTGFMVWVAFRLLQFYGVI